jgi:tetratricopeptide (TPR) repeat protein
MAAAALMFAGTGSALAQATRNTGGLSVTPALPQNQQNQQNNNIPPITRPLPPASYYQAVNALYDGDYRTALEGLKQTYSLGLQTAGGKWIDSICPLTMAGECHYKRGELAAALENYEAAIRLANPNSLVGVQFPAEIPPREGIREVPWGRSARNTQTGRFAATNGVLTGLVLYDPIPNQTGNPTLLPPNTIVPLNVQEVVRCTVLAIKRRRELMGPVCLLDPLTATLEGRAARRAVNVHPCVQAWFDAEAGFAFLANGQSAQAIESLKRAETLPGSGGIDHPLTPLVLLGQGQMALEAGDSKTAGELLAEASYSAAAFGDLTVLEDAFRLGEQAYLMSHPDGLEPFPPLAAAIAWSKNRGRELQATLWLLTAENDALLNRTSRAASALAEAKSLFGRRDMGSREIGARLNYLSGMVAYQQGRAAAAEQALGEALEFERTASKRLFQITLADRFASGQAGWPVTPRRALPLYAAVLEDPTAADWSADPLDAIAALATPHPLPFEHWFEMARQSDVELSLEVADRLRRHRFLSTLPLGGRLMALRWLLEAPSDALAPPSQLQRQDLLTRFPKYADLSRKARNLRAELTSVPLAADGADAVRKQAEKLAELDRVSAEQEAMLHELALRRENAEMVFPPVRKTKDVQAALLPRQFLMAFLKIGDGTYAWLMSKNRCAAWRVQATPAVLERQIAVLLRAIGNMDANHTLSQNELADTGWRGEARATLEALTAGSKVNLSANIDELIVVPDGSLWYVPFEALEVAKDKQAKETTALITKSRIRYVPTMGLAVPNRRESRPLGQTGVVLGKLHPRDDVDASSREFDQLAKIAQPATPIKRSLPAAAPVYGSLFDTLIVLDDLPTSDKAPGAGDRQPAYDWSPIPLDRARGAGSLAAWLTLPWKSSAQVILPGFHSPAENSMRQAPNSPAGNDLFLATCGLMSTGARTVLISRWRTGGESCHELVRHFVEELPHTSAADAWQRSVEMLWETPLEFDREPRVTRAAGAEGATARHPLLWSGYMLIDTGWAPPKPEQVANK